MVKQLIRKGLFLFLFLSFALPTEAYFGATPRHTHTTESVTPTQKKKQKRQKKSKRKKHRRTDEPADGLNALLRFLAVVLLFSGAAFFSIGAVLSGGALTGMALVGFIFLLVAALMSFLNLASIVFVGGFTIGLTLLGLGLALANPLLWIVGASLAAVLLIWFIIDILLIISKYNDEEKEDFFETNLNNSTAK